MITETIIGSLIGLGGSLGTGIFDFFKTKQSNQHELEMMRLQKEIADADRELKAHQTDLQFDIDQRRADIDELKAVYAYNPPVTNTWVDIVANSVRPGITYAYFGAYLMVKVAMFYVGVTDRGIAAGNMMLTLWTDADMLLFSTILSFWFGNRSLMNKRLGSK